MKHIKQFENVAAANGWVIDNPFVSTIISTGQILTCLDGEYIIVEDNLAVIAHMIPKPANNEFYYRTVLNEPVYPNENALLGENDTILNIVSNTYDDDFKGYRMVFDGNLVKVGDNAFYKNCGFTYISFPDSLERLCYRSFRECSNQWMYIHFGSGIKYIDSQAFHADQIKNLVFPSSLISVEDAFWYAGIYNEDGILRLPAGISYGCLFSNAWSFDTLIFEEGITEIGILFNGAEPSDVKHVILPTTLRTIGPKTFDNNPLLTEITLPTGLQLIGEQSFSQTGLTSIEIPNSVTSIGKSAFYACTGLTSAMIGNSVTSIGIHAFRNCSSLTSVTIGNSVISIGDYAFRSCSSLTSVTIPDSVTSIGKYVFRDCISLTSVTIGNSLTSIGYAAFFGCSGLTSITIPSNITSIEDGAFYGCTGLTSVTIPSSVTSIGGSAFGNCTSLTTVSIPSSITSISNYAFSGLANVQSITVDSNNRVYDSRNNCNAIIETSTNKLIAGNIDITIIPDTVTTIGYASFAMSENNTRTNSVDIPASVTAIEKWAFELIPTLTTVTCRATNPPTLDALAFEGSSNIAHIYVPAESVETYKAATNWSAFASIIEAISA